MSLCTVCKSIDLLGVPKLPASYGSYAAHNKSALLIDVGKRRRRGEAAIGKDVDESLGIAFHQSLGELEEAAKECPICKVVQQDVFDFQTALAEDQGEKRKWRKTEGPDGKMWLAKGVNEISGFMVVSADAGDNNVVWILSAVGLCVDDDSPLGNVVAGRKIEDDASKEASVQRASNWLQHCDMEDKDTALPQRVLDVKDSTSGRLSIKESAGETGRYAVLSYIDNTDISTTTANMGVELHENGILFDSLPKIFQDAVTITRKLGIQYLWIRRLCITKDDLPALSRSSPQYASIYKNAYITLSATGSPNDDTSMLTTRSPPRYTTFTYTHDTVQGTMYASSLPKEPTLYPGNDRILHSEPLSQDPWSLQERLFSPRILHFGTKQMYFECDTHFLSEDGFKMTGRNDTLNSESQYKWQNVLDLYCRRPLHHSSDKLPALSNIAAVLAKKSGDTYVAGLWRSSLIVDLAWQATGFAVGRTSEPATYRAPSWSWAYIDGPFGKFRPGSGWDAGEWVDVAKVQDVDVTLKGEDPYGEVESAWLKLRAPLEPLSMADDAPNPQAWKMKKKNGSEPGAACIFDTRARATRARDLELYVVLLTKCKLEGVTTWAYHGVVVAGVSGREGVYERMGKVVYGEENLGECEWMKDEAKLVDIMLV